MDELEKILDVTPSTDLEQTPEQIPAQESVADPSLDPAPNQSPSNQHFKAVKQLKERAEKERDDALARLRDYESRQSPQDDQDISIGNDELAEGKHLKAMANKIKKLENQIQQSQSQSHSSLVETRLKMEYPDIEKVVCKENIDVLSAQYPELANTLNSSNDLYSKAVSAYTLIKKLGIQPEDNYQQDRIKAQLNANKPRPLTSVSPQQGDSPLSHANAFANGLTDELKSQLYKEMMNARM